MKTGVDYIYQNRLQRDLDQQFTFSDAVTSNINQTNTCNSLASALLAAPATFTAQTPSFAEDYFNTQLPQLTLNFGLRDEFVPQIHILDNRLANGLDIPNQTYTISASSVAVCSATVVNPCIPGGMGAVPFNNHIAFANNRQQGGRRSATTLDRGSALRMPGVRRRWSMAVQESSTTPLLRGASGYRTTSKGRRGLGRPASRISRLTFCRIVSGLVAHRMC